jgi:hypothetical protein
MKMKTTGTRTRRVLTAAVMALALAAYAVTGTGGFGKTASAEAATAALIFECSPQANGTMAVATWSGTSLAPILAVGLSCAEALRRLFVAGFTMQSTVALAPDTVVYTYTK